MHRLVGGWQDEENRTWQVVWPLVRAMAWIQLAGGQSRTTTRGSDTTIGWCSSVGAPTCSEPCMTTWSPWSSNGPARVVVRSMTGAVDETYRLLVAALSDDGS